jgi:CheY-like chemotaxis protein
MRHEPFEDTPEPRDVRGLRPATAGAAAIILLADDDDLCRGILKEVLEDEGYEVQECSDGVETIELLASAADGDRPVPDVLVLDVNMPGYSGLGVLNVLRRFGKQPRTIVVTGMGDPSVHAFARRLGAVAVFRKPADLDALLSEVLAAAKAKG